jgi:hypothetical protein
VIASHVCELIVTVCFRVRVHAAVNLGSILNKWTRFDVIDYN